MTQTGYLFIGLTAIVAMLVAVMMFALLRFSAAARNTRRQTSEESAHAALLSSALQEAVTKLKAQEQAMSVRAVASEQLSVQIVDSLTAGFLLVDRESRVEILNPAGRRMLGLARDPIGVSYQELLGAVPPLVAVIGECLATAAPIVRRTLALDGPPRPSHLGVTVSPIGNVGSPRGVICLFSDLTKVIELEERLRMKEALARVGELTAGIAHEFRNGLATIHGYSRLIDPQALPDPYRRYVEGIRQETDALGKVVTNFLNFARSEQILLAPVELEPLVRRAADDLQRELPEGTEVCVDGAFGCLQGDEILLRQMFGNLIRNAAEACGRAGVRPAIHLASRAQADGGSVVTIEDNGPGIPDDLRDKVFQPFFTTRSNGTGLGLAIVQKIVVLHNGRVTIGRSAAGGAAIQIAFPGTA